MLEMKKEMNEEKNLQEQKQKLATLLIAGCALANVTGYALANTVDLSGKPIDTPTIDYLNSLGLTSQNSYYKMTKHSTFSNTITKYIYDETTGTTTEKYYTISYGSGNLRSRVQNSSYTSEITGLFAGISAPYGYSGGAISNYGSGATIGTITADFINNYSGYYGGAIANECYNGSIDIITGDFIGNYSNGLGGAIYNYGSIGSITGDFIDNYIGYQASRDTLKGGAIYNSGTINTITGDFIENSASYIYSYGNGYGEGGAIYNGGSIGTITGDFIANVAGGEGGAIYNSGTINTITGNFIKNKAGANGSYGGAIYNGGTIDTITGDFSDNYASSFGGAIANYGSGATIYSITGDFSGNYTNYNGGAIYNYSGYFATITGDFNGNNAKEGVRFITMVQSAQ